MLEISKKREQILIKWCWLQYILIALPEERKGHVWTPNNAEIIDK